MCRWRSALNYLAGLVAGDGTIYYYEKNKEYFVYVYDSDEEFLRKVGEMVAKTLKVAYTVVKPSVNANYYRLQFTSKKVYEYVKKLLNERPKKPTKNFVRGLIDAEGSLYVDKKGRITLQVGLTDEALARAVHSFLTKKGIRATLVAYNDKRGNRSTIYKVYIRGWMNVGRLIAELEPLHPKIAGKYRMLLERRPGGGRPP